MKAKILRVFIVLGLAVLALVACYMISTLFKMGIKAPGEDAARVSPATASGPAVSDTVIEVGGKPKPAQPEPEPRQSGTAQPPSQLSGQPSQLAAGNQPRARESVNYSQPVGKVSFISGTITAVDHSGKGRMLLINSEIFNMDRVECGASAKVEIKFEDGTVISLGEKSTIVIEESIFTPLSPPACGFIIRFTRGVCRVVTGLITDLNPDRFRVRTSLATAGIRGCDLVFKSSASRDDIYVLDMARTKSVEIDTSSDGSEIMNPDTGREIRIEDSRKRHFSITQPNNAVSVARGSAPEQNPVSASDIRDMITETSRMTPARYELKQSGDGAVLQISPDNLHSPGEK